MSSGSKGRQSKTRPRPSLLSEEGQIVTIIDNESDNQSEEEDIQASKKMKPRNEEKTDPILKNFTKSHKDEVKKSIYVILEGSSVRNHAKEQSDLADQYENITGK